MTQHYWLGNSAFACKIVIVPTHVCRTTDPRVVRVKHIRNRAARYVRSSITATHDGTILDIGVRCADCGRRVDEKVEVKP